MQDVKHGVETKKTCNMEERKKSTRKSRKTEKGQTVPKKQTKKGLVCLSISVCVCHSLEITASLVLIPITHYA